MPNARFPNDDNGDVLRRMEESGDDLTQSREIDFSFIFDDEERAVQFVDYVKEEGYNARLHHDELFDPPWDVTVTIDMVPSHNSITAEEERLGKWAAPLGGRNDGWGCFEVSK